MRGWLAGQVRGWGSSRAAHLWQPNSSGIIRTTQPAWLSTMWNFLSRDYDTRSSFFDTKKALESVHSRLNLKAGRI
jgi:hypothetical protein